MCFESTFEALRALGCQQDQRGYDRLTAFVLDSPWPTADASDWLVCIAQPCKDAGCLPWLVLVDAFQNALTCAQTIAHTTVLPVKLGLMYIHRVFTHDQIAAKALIEEIGGIASIPYVKPPFEDNWQSATDLA